MPAIESPLGSLLKASSEGAVLIVLVLAIQWAFRNRLHPRWRYALWLLVLVRLALPAAIPAPISVFNLVKLAPTLVAAQPKPETATAQASALSVSRQLTSTPGKSALQPPRWGRQPAVTTNVLLGLWMLGSLALAAYLVITHHLLARRISRLRPVTDKSTIDLLEDCKEQMGVRVPVMLVETAEVGSPSLFGFVRPRLLLPAGLRQTFTPAELRCVFLHELGHVKRHDILVAWLTVALQLLHWFNPLVWLAFYRMRVDRELACDALALSRAGEVEQQCYGHTIIKLLERFGRPAWAPSLAGAVENHKQLKERIRMIAKFKHTNRGPVLAVALVAGLALITLTDAQQTVSGDLSKDLIGTWILVGRPGQVAQPPAVGGRTKTFTDTQWSITQTDPSDGVVIFHHGGPYTLKGNEYVETMAFANENTKDRIGKTHKYTLKIEGDLLTQTGIDNQWREVWKRVRTDSPKPQKSELKTLEGAWHGHEAGVPGTCSMVIRGSTMEYHGANSNEWYKASVSVYETTPKQAVILITECPFPDFKGETAYTIYQIQDGTLTISGNQPGSPVVPASFDAPGTRKMVFQRD